MTERFRPAPQRFMSPLLSSIYDDVGEFLDRNRLIVEMHTPNKQMLGFRQTQSLEQNSLSLERRILTEMQAFLPVASFDFGQTHSGESIYIHVGSTPAHDPHTYLTVPAQVLVDSFRRQFNEQLLPKCAHMRYEKSAMTASGLTLAQTSQHLALHGLSWIVLQVGNQVMPIDAAELITQRNFDQICTLRDEERQARVNNVLTTFDKYTHINALALNELYKFQILPKMWQVVAELQAEGILSRDLSWFDIESNLSIEGKGNTRFINIGHHFTQQQLANHHFDWPDLGRDELDTGRGPASVATAHSFLRIIPYKRLIRIFLKSKPNATPEEQVEFVNLFVRRLLQKVGGWQLGPNEKIFVIHEPSVFAAENTERFVKSLDVYGQWESAQLLKTVGELIMPQFLALDPTVKVKNLESIAEEENPYSRHVQALSFTFDESVDPGKILSTFKSMLQLVTKYRYDVLSQPGTSQPDVAQPLQGWVTKLLAYQPTLKQAQRAKVEVAPTHSETRTHTKAELRKVARYLWLKLWLSATGDSSFSAPFFGVNDELRAQVHVLMADAREMQRMLTTFERFGVMKAGELEHDSAIAFLTAQFLELHRVGILFNSPRPLNASVLPGFLFSYNYITEKNEAGEFLKRLHVVVSVMGGEAASVEHVKGLAVERMADKS